MDGNVYGFDWDDANTKKCRKHGVSIEEIEFLFMNDPDIFLDVKHSQKEIRYLAIGKNLKGRSVLSVFTYRIKNGFNYVRPISARYMHKKEINYYKKYEE